eukprot:gnl/TRDRNA2_/TRDRNA2_125933_c0_seq1.p1 gnl/TRDRNA2_/TRDRNA2_125933_c0~~gnl/TRDRNA2_/TRDRNA2_125933_c0_seq1.p1  ORF type:complete len:595 (+),score=66.96 gnl/TRDRNA2_/TRDRNA2_125933_c0_seq1:107-1786(+)
MPKAKEQAMANKAAHSAHADKGKSYELRSASREKQLQSIFELKCPDASSKQAHLLRLLMNMGDLAAKDFRRRIANDTDIVIRGVCFDRTIMQDALQAWERACNSKVLEDEEAGPSEEVGNDKNVTEIHAGECIDDASMPAAVAADNGATQGAAEAIRGGDRRPRCVNEQDFRIEPRTNEGSRPSTRRRQGVRPAAEHKPADKPLRESPRLHANSRSRKQPQLVAKAKADVDVSLADPRRRKRQKMAPPPEVVARERAPSKSRRRPEQERLTTGPGAGSAKLARKPPPGHPTSARSLDFKGSVSPEYGQPAPDRRLVREREAQADDAGNVVTVTSSEKEAVDGRPSRPRRMPRQVHSREWMPPTPPHAVDSQSDHTRFEIPATMGPRMPLRPGANSWDDYFVAPPAMAPWHMMSPVMPQEIGYQDQCLPPWPMPASQRGFGAAAGGSACLPPWPMPASQRGFGAAAGGSAMSPAGLPRGMPAETPRRDSGRGGTFKRTALQWLMSQQEFVDMPPIAYPLIYVRSQHGKTYIWDCQAGRSMTCPFMPAAGMSSGYYRRDVR